MEDIRRQIQGMLPSLPTVVLSTDVLIADSRCELYIRLFRTHDVDTDGEIFGYCLCIWLAIIFYCLLFR